MMTARQSFLFGIILAVYFAAGVLFAVLTPPWQAPDEPAHFNYVRYLSLHTGFPELVTGCYDQNYLAQLTSEKFPPDLPVDTICYEYHQPPLYYLQATPIFAVSSGSLLVMRLFSVMLGAGVVVLAFVIARTVFPGQPAVAFGAMAFVAFVPMHVAMLSSVNNDALAELILATILLLLLRRLMHNLESARHNVVLGIVLGLGLLAKTTVYIAVPLTAATLLLATFTARRHPETNPWPALVKHGVVIFGIALLIGLPWYVRNAGVYGNFDILGLGRHNEVVVGQLRTADYLAQVGWQPYLLEAGRTTFHSFWGQFGWMAVPMDRRTYRLLEVLVVAAGVGLGIYLAGQWKKTAPGPRLSGRQWQALVLLALAVGFMLLAYGWYNLSFKQLQGRYLFPGLIPVGIFVSLGLRQILSPQVGWWLVGGLAAALALIAAESLRQGGLDKWAVLILGAFLAAALARQFLPRYSAILTGGLFAACFIGLALLALASPFWFIQPYL
ncbi:MAG: DUF2142 domain-containing protein [Chloroflexi bacterium]|nr:MAG: DUF2142 domain-containing protein [Chloroflexota bacterium]